MAGYSSLNNYEASQNTTQNWFRFGTRLDQIINDSQRLAIHYNTFNSEYGQTRVGGPLHTAPSNGTEGGLAGSVKYDWTYRPTLLFNFRASVNHAPGFSGSTADPSLNVGTLNLNPAINSILGGYPQYGPVDVLGSNLGSSFYNSLNIRLEHRMSHGLSFLLNYTYSRLLDDVGGPEADTSGGMTSTGNGGKTPQSIYTFASTWGLSANDQPHRLVLTYVYELPFGQGKHWLNSPKTLGEKVLDRIAGGWQFSGNTSYSSGTPVTWWGTTTVNTNNTIKVETTYGSYAGSDHNLGNSAYQGDNHSLLSPSMAPAAGISRFAANKMITAQNFVAGNLPAVDPSLRNPSFTQTDLSLMKNFYITPEKRYVQIRAEAQNAFNIRGFGTYNNQLGNPYFGMITNAGNGPHQIQLSARFIF